MLTNFSRWTSFIFEEFSQYLGSPDPKFSPRTLISITALDYIPSDDYHTWIDIGMTLKDAGYYVTLWDKWSSSSNKYKSGECERKWQSFNGSGKTIGTLFYLAKYYGFDQKQWMEK